MHLEVFANGNSLIHKIDPRVKFITFFPLVLAIAINKNLYVSLSALLITIIMAVAACLDLHKFIQRLITVNIFILFLWFFFPFSYEGQELFSLGTLKVSKEGVINVLIITLKANSIVILTIATLGTSSLFNLAHALVHLKVPIKLVYLFFFCYRYITLLHEEYERLLRAAQIRGFFPKMNVHTYKTYAYLIGMLIVRSYERSERVYHAMLCRGLTDRFPIMSHFTLNVKDYIFAAFMFLITSGLIQMQIFLI